LGWIRQGSKAEKISLAQSQLAAQGEAVFMVETLQAMSTQQERRLSKVLWSLGDIKVPKR